MKCILSGEETKVTTLGHYPIKTEFVRMIPEVRDAYQEEQHQKVEADVRANNEGNNLSEESLQILVKSLAPKISRRRVVELAAKGETRILEMFGVDIDNKIKDVALNAAKGML